MTGPAHRFDDAAAYDRFMGDWSRAVGAVFLDWLAPPADADWLEIGCGTGAFTELALATCAPASLAAVDPAPAQIEHARRRAAAGRARFEIADAQSLPFAEASFDVVASALVINFIPDRPRALAEMRRVARPGAVVAGYVWDFAAELSPTGPLRRAMRSAGVEAPAMPGTADSRCDALAALFAAAGFADIATRSVEVTLPFADFEALWQAQTPACHPATRAIDAMADGDRARMIAALRSALPAGTDGRIAQHARANAIKARAPG